MKNTAFPILTNNEQQLPFYVTSIGIEQVQEHIVRPKGYPAYQWIQCRSGSGRLVIGEDEHFVEKDQGMFLLPGQPHEYYSDSDEDWVVDWVGLTGTGVEQFLKEIAGLTDAGVYSVSQPQLTRGNMEQILAATQSESPVKGLDISALAYAFVTNLYKLISAGSTGSMDSRYNRLTPILDYIEEHYSESITLKQLSEIMDVTPQHLCTLFRKNMNTRIFEYINLLRIQKSKDLLLTQPSLAIRDVAHHNGFEDVSYFCYIFKRIEKSTPGDFRKMHVRA